MRGLGLESAAGSGPEKGSDGSGRWRSTSPVHVREVNLSGAQCDYVRGKWPSANRSPARVLPFDLFHLDALFLPPIDLFFQRSIGILRIDLRAGHRNPSLVTGLPDIAPKILCPWFFEHSDLVSGGHMENRANSDPMRA
jgi:hypothetical protein